jgi:pilus assembly protein CpaF
MFGKRPATPVNLENKPAASMQPAQSNANSNNAMANNSRPAGPRLNNQGMKQQVEKISEIKISPMFQTGQESVKEKLIYTDQKLESEAYKRAKQQVFEVLVEKFNFNALNQLPREQQIERINQATIKIVNDLSLPLNSAQLDLLRAQIIDDTRGFGPLEKLLNDPDVADIMINTAKMVYVEKGGKIYMTDLTFASEAQLLNIIQKIVSQVGRRVDESSPMVDARMPDGSRFNAIIPPLAIDGALVSIRKFKKTKMALEDYITMGSMSEGMFRFLRVCAASRASIVVSGGTGSGKTTLLNALSAYIDIGERVITIEDAAELQLKQPHVLRLETRPANIEGIGSIDQRALLKNALRMRPDRIILGEIRGEEVIDVLQAMNTGHEGSMATVHANNPRDTLTRIENLCSMSGVSISSSALRQQIASALNLIVQVSRMRDGVRRVTSITEVVKVETDTILMQELFSFEPGQIGEDGRLQGRYICHKIRPTFSPQIDYFGLTRELERSLEFASN